MPKAPDTNVRIPQSALDALMRVVGRRRLSRDETARRLLDEHLAQQEPLDGLGRLTHISTVIGYPPRRIGRSQPRHGVPLRLRLDEGVAERLRAVSLMLPGQHVRGRHEYQAPLLTDAVMTAIARDEPIEDPELDGLMPLIRHGAAIGLWRLVVAAFSTRSEKKIYELAQREALRRAQGPGTAGWSWYEKVAAVLQEEDVAWHSPYRLRAAHFLARRLLAAGATAMETVLFERDSLHWDALLVGMLGRNEFNDPFAGFGPPPHTLEGRGGSAVWRAERELASDAALMWLRQTDDPAAARQWLVRQPGWTLVLPERWRPLLVPAGSAVPRLWRSHVEEGRVLQLAARRYTVLWPTIGSSDDGPAVPVPRIEHVMAAGRHLPAADLMETLLIALWPLQPDDDPGESDDDRDLDPVDPWELAGVSMTAHRAYQLGLIDLIERDRLNDIARTNTQDEMTRIIASLHRVGKPLAKQLELHMNDPTQFARIARKAGKSLTIAVWEWTWHGDSLAAAVEDPTIPPAALTYFAERMIRRHRRWLELSMENAAKAAFARFGP